MESPEDLRNHPQGSKQQDTHVDQHEEHIPKISSGKANKSKSSCCIPHCTVTGYVVENGKKVTFHSLPKNNEALKKWLVNIRRDTGTNFCISKYTKVCSRHFRDEDFLITAKGRKFLKNGAVPTKFTWTKANKPRRVLQRNSSNMDEALCSKESDKDITNKPNKPTRE